MFKKFLLVLMIGSFMVGTAFAGVKEMKEAYLSEDYATCISEARKVIADVNASIEDKAIAQRYIGHSYYRQTDYAKALTELQKVITDYPGEIRACAIAQYYIGHCYERIGKTVEAQEAWIKVCRMQEAHLTYVKVALSKLDKVALGKEEYLKLLDTMIFIIPTTGENAEFLGLLKSEQEKLR